VKPPCEIVSKYVLPAIRALIARRLIEQYGYTQLDAAKTLGMTQSAMSRYMALERGGKIKVTKEINKLIDDIAKNIVKGKLSQEKLIKKLCYVCETFRKSGNLCKIHRELSPIVPKTCKICLKF
jgi:hypothetical protein